MKRILVIQTAFLGDAILTLPMIRKLKESYPESEIDVVAIPSTAEIFEASPGLNKVFITDKKGKDKSVFALFKFIKVLKKNNYDVIYSPHRSLRSSLMVIGTGVKETYGFSNSSLRHVYKHLVKYEPSHHEVRRNLELAGLEADSENWRILPEVPAAESEIRKVDGFIGRSAKTGKIAAVAPGSVWNTKKYPVEYYDEIIKFLNKKGFHTIIIGGGKDKEICEDLLDKNRDAATSAAGIFSVAETIELLRRTKILISNDSAPTHMGVSAGIPVLTIYCSTVAGFGFFPYNENSDYVSYDDLKCKPCGIHGRNKCPINTFACGYNLKPRTVTNKLEEILDDKN